ncbi:tRNA (adenosine(37)-N6)-threonylcarbamoyltransferase complex ATPase subunit type 1 TsaE [Ramlibacter sp. H39-3-26]|uniref:tRNA (adenosine(37)-N6)-threonylcarbamoyltransferase complex ATPase subunit type 1 TsaE n=1 Tax=Curvibacter soli TaxID=3031331 RepID=UPI0023DC3196|nr:tRNA (adenosine(37)-N6)-threonylcarbamoyltransferase complex ATPase subunit type 1 TsaE [Ramlibacter sp. H39-3-26]MDF1486484.1 tRNA (adenosine(37)-N6)-threonylcarbamoyltransferase complex ATPase subunit type 1 TsaE [Ramlibacter sp. H39-3-26]
MTAADHHRPIVETRLLWRDEADTAAFAQALARTFAQQPAPRDAYIELQGDLGAGKTTLVRHLLRALGVAGRIKSPTYAVVEPHDAAGLPVWHFDFYRFGDPREWEDAGLRDIFASPGLKIAEWPENAAALVPIADLAIKIEADQDELRHVTLRAASARGQALLRGATTA